MIRSFIGFIALVLISISVCSAVNAAIVNVEPGSGTLQAAIDSASDGDILLLSSGFYKGDINYKGKAITVKGVGIASIIKGTGNIATVMFSNNEGFSSLLDQVAITGGSRAGAILISEASPRVNRSWIINNKSIGAGSGIYVFGTDADGNSASFFNNVIVRNKTNATKPSNNAYPIYIEDSSPSFINNTIVLNQNSAVFITGDSTPRFTNNIIGYSGVGSKSIGVELYNYDSALASSFDYNLFYQNKFDVKVSNNVNLPITKYKTFNEFANSTTLVNGIFNENINGNPKFIKAKFLDLRLGDGSAAIDVGNPDEFFNDLDNSRNDIGATGGLFINPDL